MAQKPSFCYFSESTMEKDYLSPYIEMTGSDKAIIEYCTLQFAELVSPVMAEYFNSSIHDAGNINNQEDALKYISLLMKLDPYLFSALSLLLLKYF